MERKTQKAMTELAETLLPRIEWYKRANFLSDRKSAVNKILKDALDQMDAPILITDRLNDNGEGGPNQAA